MNSIKSLIRDIKGNQPDRDAGRVFVIQLGRDLIIHKVTVAMSLFLSNVQKKCVLTYNTQDIMMITAEYSYAMKDLPFIKKDPYLYLAQFKSVGNVKTDIESFMCHAVILSGNIEDDVINEMRLIVRDRNITCWVFKKINK